MTRAQELRRLLREVEAGGWDAAPAENVSVEIIGILAERTGNYEACFEIIETRRLRNGT